MTEVVKNVEVFKRGLLAKALAQCTAIQRHNFARIYPSTVPMNRLEEAIGLCERTIRKNKQTEETP